MIAESPYIANDALAELIDVDYDLLDAVTMPQQAVAEGAPLIRDDKEGQDSNHIYSWESGTRTRPRRRSPTPTWWSRWTRTTRGRTLHRSRRAAAS